MKKNTVNHFYDESKISFAFMSMNAIDTIYHKCRPYAGKNEFQVHYRSIVFECWNNGAAKAYFTIPTVFYNMPQQVSHSYIEFHTDDVHKNGEMVKELSMLMGQKMTNIKEYLENTFDNVKMTEVADNSIHRHPGDFGFSLTDYDDDLDEPGVIYRKGQCKELIQTDSVMYFGAKTKLVVTESRIATVQKSGASVYAEYVEIPTIMTTKQERYSAIYKLFNNEPKVEYDINLGEWKELDIDEIKKVCMDVVTMMPEPNTECVIPEYITEAKVKATTVGETKVDTNDEFAIADQLGYNLHDPKDRADWEATREYYMEGDQWWE